ncbi:coat protein [Pistacia-associated flexivirus 1]|uniref:Coat protein n=1 Tax=Entoleuca gammaflexivirus 2 TaxID=2086642 RepID=A0AAD0ZZT2_9VIRU|nr:coat protein [Entoleuca gammaflexivirus 2]AZG06257.1 coat protein [Entoleuca gammaflexivirus 2]
MSAPTEQTTPTAAAIASLKAVDEPDQVQIVPREELEQTSIAGEDATAAFANFARAAATFARANQLAPRNLVKALALHLAINGTSETRDWSDDTLMVDDTEVDVEHLIDAIAGLGCTLRQFAKSNLAALAHQQLKQHRVPTNLALKHGVPRSQWPISFDFADGIPPAKLNDNDRAHIARLRKQATRHAARTQVTPMHYAPPDTY